jgi:stage III sporulation protein AD
MIQFFQAIGAVLLTVVLVQVLKQGSPGIGGLLSLLTCVLVLLIALHYFRPLADFISTLERMTHLDSGLLKMLFKVVGIAIIAETAEMICADSGNQAMGKALQLLASTVILCLAVPMMTDFLELVEGILKGL